MGVGEGSGRPDCSAKWVSVVGREALDLMNFKNEDDFPTDVTEREDLKSRVNALNRFGRGMDGCVTGSYKLASCE